MTTVNAADLPPTGGPEEADVAALAANAAISDDELIALGMFDKVKAARGETSPSAEPPAASGDPATPATGEAGAAGPTAPATPAIDDEDGEAGAIGPLIPKPRFDQVNARRKAAEADVVAARAEAEQLKGRLSVFQEELERLRADLPAAARTPATPQPEAEPADPRALIKQAKRLLAKAYNDGEIDFEEYEAQREELEDRQLDLVAASARLDPATLADTIDVQRQSAELEAANLWYGDLKDHERTLVKDEALERLTAEGKGTQGPKAELRYRQLMVEVGKEYGLDAKAAARKGAPAPVRTTPSAPPQPAPRTAASDAADNARAKLDLAARQPLDLHAAPTPTGPAALDLEGIGKLDRKDFLELPKATRERYYAEAGVD